MKSYVIDAARTPRGRGKAGKGALSNLHPQEIFAQVHSRIHRLRSIEASRTREQSSPHTSRLLGLAQFNMLNPGPARDD